jgi:hypothetical protein
MRLPAVSVAISALQLIEAELDRVYPAEGILVPLLGLLPRDPGRTPCAPLELEGIAEIVVARAVRLPPERQANALCRVQALPEVDAIVNREVLALTRAHPRLRACGYLHSHPFARGRTAPSRGPACDVEGHMLPLLERNRRAGLEASFSLIACRDLWDRGWLIQAFALLPAGELVDLGPARAIADEAPALAELLTPELRAREPERSLLRRWRRELGRAGLRHRIDELFEGWLRVVVPVARGQVVILVPLALPSRPLRVFAVPEGRGARAIAAPRSLAPDAWLRAVARGREVIDAA